MRPADEARRLSDRYGRAFSPEYKASTDPEVAAQDILELEAMRADDRVMSISLSRDSEVDGAEAGGAMSTGSRLTKPM
jgi:NAD-specific glutamate dehydrogenase